MTDLERRALGDTSVFVWSGHFAYVFLFSAASLFSQIARLVQEVTTMLLHLYENMKTWSTFFHFYVSNLQRKCKFYTFLHFIPEKCLPLKFFRLHSQLGLRLWSKFAIFQLSRVAFLALFIKRIVVLESTLASCAMGKSELVLHRVSCSHAYCLFCDIKPNNYGKEILEKYIMLICVRYVIV